MPSERCTVKIDAENLMQGKCQLDFVSDEGERERPSVCNFDAKIRNDPAMF